VNLSRSGHLVMHLNHLKVKSSQWIRHMQTAKKFYSLTMPI